MPATHWRIRLDAIPMLRVDPTHVFVLSAVALALSASLALVTRRLALHLGLVDRPDAAAHKSHLQATPYGGGVAIWLGMALTTLPFLAWSTRSLAGAGLLLGCATLMLILGLADDWRPMPAFPRLMVQLAAAAALVSAGAQYRLPVGPPAIAIPVTILWILALTNAYNFLDNMDGLSAGLAAVACLTLGAMAWNTGSREALVLLAGVLGALLGFLLHNFPPATVFMGDAGGLSVGFLLSGLGAGLSRHLATMPGSGGPWAWLGPLMVFALPLYDLGTVTAIRIRAGAAPWTGDNNHISHRLVAGGLSRRSAVVVLYGAAAATALPALLIQRLDGWHAALMLGAYAAAIAVVGRADRRERWKANQPNA